MDLLMEYVPHRRIHKQRRKEGKKEQRKKEPKRKEEINQKKRPFDFISYKHPLISLIPVRWKNKKSGSKKLYIFPI